MLHWVFLKKRFFFLELLAFTPLQRQGVYYLTALKKFLPFPIFAIPNICRYDRYLNILFPCSQKFYMKWFSENHVGSFYFWGSDPSIVFSKNYSLKAEIFQNIVPNLNISCAAIVCLPFTRMLSTLSTNYD